MSLCDFSFCGCVSLTFFSFLAVIVLASDDRTHELVRGLNHVKSRGPVAFKGILALAVGVCLFDASFASISTACLLSETVNPGSVGAFATRNYVILPTVLEVLAPKFHATLNLDLFHAAVFGLALDVVSRDK